ncbi:MAG TPA: peptidoglycan DD-metalloendopeptidase family protein [Nocardioidaceae bacterium]|nr:peptidoglycan DD-metalloendopeptidase family protein [Nocardioidaceae bacterium]
MRTFPRTSRRRVGAVLAASSLLLSFAALPLASADDLRDRKDRVEGNISRTLKDLDQSSAELMAATRALEAAQAQLDAAQQHLAETRGELAVAVVLDRRMQKALDKAVSRLRDARRQLAQGRAEVAAQEDVLGQLAVQNYQQGDPSLVGLSMVLNSEDPTELSGQLNSVRNVLDKESVTLDRLDASRVLLEVKEDEVEQAKREVAKKRREAAENLERKKVLEAQAEDAEKAVSTLVSARAEAHGAAAEAKRADLESLRGLQQERDRISEVLAARAEEARRQAEAAAAAAAAQASAASRGSNGFLDYPVDTYITSSYGMRLHPVYHRWTLHDGTDFGAPCGTPIRAAASGEVIAVYYNAGYGNRVIMDNGYHRGVGLGTAYNHLSSYSTYEGQKVKRGEVIGYVGNTGYSTGCHLHFMVFENGATVNPMNWL